MPPSRVTAIFLFPRATLSPSSSTYRSISTQPLRPQLHPRQQQQQFTKQTISFFSTSNPTWAREPNFYEILDVPTTASAAEIKKYTTHTIIPPAPSPSPIPYMFLNTYLHTQPPDNSTPSQCATTQTATAQTQTQANASPAFPPPTTSSATMQSVQSMTATTASTPPTTPQATATNTRWAATAATPARGPPVD